jgi:hypothetical protein
MAAAARQALQRLSAAVFGTVLNPSNQRNGLKELRKNLVGPAVVHYYPTPARVWARLDPTYVDEDVEYAVGKAARLRRRGKGPPKKGTRALEGAARCHAAPGAHLPAGAHARTQARASGRRSRRRNKAGPCLRTRAWSLGPLPPASFLCLCTGRASHGGTCRGCRCGRRGCGWVVHGPVVLEDPADLAWCRLRHACNRRASVHPRPHTRSHTQRQAHL